MLEKAIVLAPTAENHALLGAADQYIALSSDALAHFEAALKLDPKNLDYKTTKGLLLGLNKRYPEGIDLLKEVIGTPAYKGVASAYVNLGWLYRHSKPPKPEEAAAAYTHALEKESNNSQAMIGLGWAHLESRHLDEGIAAFQKGVEDPKINGEALNGIAWCYVLKGDLDKAREYRDKGVKAGRPDPVLSRDIDLPHNHPKPGDAPKPTHGPILEEKPDLGVLVDRLRHGTPSQRKQAATEMGKIRESVPHLCYCVETEPDVAVRDVAVTSLGMLGIGPESRACLTTALRTECKTDMFGNPAGCAPDADFKRHIKMVLGIQN